MNWSFSTDLLLLYSEVDSLRQQLQQSWQERINLGEKLGAQYEIISLAKKTCLLFALTRPGMSAPSEAYEGVTRITAFKEDTQVAAWHARIQELQGQVELLTKEVAVATVARADLLAELNQLRSDTMTLRRAYNMAAKVISALDIETILYAKNKIAEIICLDKVKS